MRGARGRPVWLLTLLAGCSTTTPTSRVGWNTAQAAAQLRCEGGDVPACGELGRSLVAAGRDRPDIRRGLVLLEGACGREDMASCAALGDWYRVQDEDPQHARASELLRRACERHVGSGCRALGDLAFDNGKDVEAAVAWFRAACELNDAEGCEKLGMFERRRDPESTTAETAWSRGCALGRLSSCYRVGLVQKRNPDTRQAGGALLARTCLRGYPPSCLPGAATFAPGIGGPPGCAEAAPLAQRACLAGTYDGCAILDACLLQQGPDEGALGRLRKGCDDGISMACFYWAEAQPPAAAGPDSPVAQAYLEACRGHSEAAPSACARSAVLQLDRAANSAEAQEPLQALAALCESGTTAACCALVKVYTAGQVVPPDSERITHFRRRTCATCCEGR